MTKEARFALALDEYEEQKALLDREYRDKVDNAPCTGDEDEDAQYRLAINMWHTQELNDLQKALWLKIKEA